jgi:ABC-type antimicrobial peptide transport system permease subunit
VQSLNRVDVGLQADGALGFTVALPEARYRAADRVIAFQEQLVDRVGRLPGVRNVALSSAPPIGEITAGVVAPTGTVTPADYRPAAVYSVSDTFAATLGVPITSGRFFERAEQRRVAVLNESLARQISPQDTVVGRSVMMIGQTLPITVIGVVGDVRQGGPARPAAPAIYLPVWQASQPIRTLHVTAQSDMPLSRLSASLRTAVSAVDPEIPLFALRTVADSIAATTMVPRFNMLVVGLFAIFSIVLALSGLYAVLAHAIEVARRDIGIRQALGATRGRILRAVLAQALWPAGTGILIGALGATGATQLIASLLFGVQAGDSLTLGLAVLLILLAAIASVLVPALRASRVDPAALLRQ